MPWCPTGSSVSQQDWALRFQLNLYGCTVISFRQWRQLSAPRRSSCVLERRHGVWLKRLYSSPTPTNFSPRPPLHASLCDPALSLFPSCLHFPPFIPRRWRVRRGSLSMLWLVLLAVVQLWRMPAWLPMSCLIKMDQHITLSRAALFSISLKRQHLMRIGTSSSVTEIHAGLFISTLRFISSLVACAAPKWISVYILFRGHFCMRPTSTCSYFPVVAKCSWAIPVTMDEQGWHSTTGMGLHLMPDSGGSWGSQWW